MNKHRKEVNVSFCLSVDAPSDSNHFFQFYESYNLGVDEIFAQFKRSFSPGNKNINVNNTTLITSISTLLYLLSSNFLMTVSCRFYLSFLFLFPHFFITGTSLTSALPHPFLLPIYVLNKCKYHMLRARWAFTLCRNMSQCSIGSKQIIYS